jgi:7-cyano-7-deazaguanine synthase
VGAGLGRASGDRATVARVASGRLYRTTDPAPAGPERHGRRRDGPNGAAGGGAPPAAPGAGGTAASDAARGAPAGAAAGAAGSGGRPPRAVVLHSGGLDSSVCLAVALRDGYEAWTLSFRYGQLHQAELAAARAVQEALGVAPAHRRVIDLGRVFAGSALTGDAELPLGRSPEAIGADVPATYVPARNLVFLALALAVAEPLGARDIFIGVNALDYSGYPDCRPEFLAAFQQAARLGTRAGATVRAPLVDLGKADIVRLGHALGVPFALTLSCYRGSRPACGLCDACVLRRRGFAEAGLEDPLPYATPMAR